MTNRKFSDPSFITTKFRVLWQVEPFGGSSFCCHIRVCFFLGVDPAWSPLVAVCWPFWGDCMSLFRSGAHLVSPRFSRDREFEPDLRDWRKNYSRLRGANWGRPVDLGLVARAPCCFHQSQTIRSPTIRHWTPP